MRRISIRRLTGLLVFLLSFFSIAIAQKHEWAKSIAASKGGTSGNQCVSIDSFNNSYISGPFLDTLFIDSKTFPPPAANGGSYLAKFNTAGKLRWCRTLNAKPSTSGTAKEYVKQVKYIYPNRIAVYGVFAESVLKISSTDSIVNPQRVNIGFMVFYDTSGNLIKYFKVFEGDSYGSHSNDDHYNGQLDCDRAGNFYLKFYKSNVKTGVFYSLGGSVALTDSIPKHIIVKYSNGFDSVLWYKEFPEFKHFSVLRLRTGGDQNLYLGCYVRGGNFTMNGINYRFPNYVIKGFLVVLSPLGNFLHTALINSDTSSYDILVDVAARDINNICLMGYSTDSILYNKKWYASKSKGHGFAYMAWLGATTGVKWWKLSSAGFNLPYEPLSVGQALGRLNIDQNGNTYGAYHRAGQVFSMGGLKDSSLNYTIFVKFDSLGNALWMMSGTNIMIDMEPDRDSNLIYVGNFYQKITLNPFTLTYKTVAAFAAKVIDYSIKRGRLKHGPYCAGDSIVVPYSKRGLYDSSNYFVAELSDENGDFEGGEREFGRVKSTKGGFVRAVLPNFQVISSGLYRIRVRSTAPPVQSFYQKDTLRLLIYSRDKANPGPPETLCHGDSIYIETFGGTKWTWSPKYNMTDSNQRKVKVYPSKTSLYQIIIGDSSGCGAPDTAFKLIVVRRPLKSILAFYDTALCVSNSLSIPVQFTGGDSLNYQWQWYFVNAPKQWFPLKKGKFKLTDTLNYTQSDSKETLAIVLKDDCTNKSDTTYLTMSIRSKISLNPKFRDTVLCKGNNISFKTKASGGVPAKYKWIWKDVNTNMLLSNVDSLIFRADQTTKIELSVSDGCQTLMDQNTFIVYVNPPLKGSIFSSSGALRDTSLCFGQNIKLYSTGKGGNVSGYNFSWYLDNSLLSTKDTLSINSEFLYQNSTQTKTLKLLLRDNCTATADSISKNITIIPSPKSEFNTGLTCNLNPIQFNFTGTKAPAPQTTSFLWDFAGQGTSTLENPTQKLTAGKQKITLKVTANNGCVDQLSKDIEFKAQAKADFDAEDVCEDTLAAFSNKTIITSGLANYLWYFGDGNTSSLDYPKHTYRINGITRTYNVKLTAHIPNGCSDSITKAITVNANPKQGFTYTVDFQTVHFSAIESSATQYRWTFGDGGIANVNKKDYSYTYSKFPSGKYKACLQVTNLAGCKSDTCLDIQVWGAVQSIQRNQFKLYPNPNSGSFMFESDNQKLTLEIFNTIGQRMYKFNITQPKTEMNLNLDTGIYLIQISNEEVIGMQKMIIKK